MVYPCRNILFVVLKVFPDFKNFILSFPFNFFYELEERIPIEKYYDSGNFDEQTPQLQYFVCRPQSFSWF